MAETRRKFDKDFRQSAVRLVRETLPAAAADRDAILAFIAFPPRGLAADLVQQPAGGPTWSASSPGRDAIRLVGAVLGEQNDERTESCRYMGWKSSPPAGRPPSPAWDRILLMRLD